MRIKIKNIFNEYKIEIIIFTILIAFYFATRIFHILSLPIFTDEAIYVRWSQIAKQDANWRFISLTDGKQPMYVWIALILMHVIKDPLLAGRFVSVFAGFGTMIGLFLLGREIFKNRFMGLVSSFLYVMYPFGLVYDRMALYDSLVGTFVVWGLFVSILLTRRIRLDLSLLLGMVVGGGMLTKTNAFFTLILFPFQLLIFDWQKKNLWQRLLKLAGFAIIAFILAEIYYSILRLSPFFHIIGEKDHVFIYSFSDWIKSPFAFFRDNFNALWHWFVTYFTFPMLALVVLSFFITKKFLQEKLLLFMYFLVPFIALAFFGKVIYPRFILFMTLSLLPLVAFTLVYLFQLVRNKIFFAAIFLLAVSMSIWSDYFILTNLARAPIADSDLNQYVLQWPSGGGVAEAITFFKQQAAIQKIFIGTEGTFGLMPYALEMYLVDNPNVIIKAYWPIHDLPPKEILDASKKMPTYVLFYQPCPSCQNSGDAPITWQAKLVLRYKKFGNNSLSVYQITPK